MTNPISPSFIIPIPMIDSPIPPEMKRLYGVTHKVIGKGGNGSVTEGIDLNSRSPVAIKTVYNIPQGRLEASILKDVKTSHSIRFRNTFTDDLKRYIIMDLIPEKNIDEAFFSEENPSEILNLDEIITITKQLLEFLDALESQNIIFGDLKLANMIYHRPSRALRVLDFGAARYSHLLEDSYAEGTVSVSAPEHLLKGKITSAHDYWSAACAIFGLITGRPLFINLGELPEEDQRNLVVQQIVQQIGKPTPEFLTTCARASEIFDQNLEFCTDMKLPESESWQDMIRESFDYYKWPEGYCDEFIDILGKLLCYENRAIPKSLLASPLFDQEIEIHFIADRRQKCKMVLHRLSDVSEPVIFLTLADISNPDLTLDLNQPVVECLHLPRDSEDQYLLVLEKDGIILKKIVSLEEGEILDIQEYQDQLAKDVLEHQRFINPSKEEEPLSSEENTFPLTVKEQRLSRFSFEQLLNSEQENELQFEFEDQNHSFALNRSLDRSFGEEMGNTVTASFEGEPLLKKQKKL